MCSRSREELQLLGGQEPGIDHDARHVCFGAGVELAHHLRSVLRDDGHSATWVDHGIREGRSLCYIRLKLSEGELCVSVDEGCAVWKSSNSSVKQFCEGLWETFVHAERVATGLQVLRRVCPSKSLARNSDHR